jgi:hypothetical protein
MNGLYPGVEGTHRREVAKLVIDDDFTAKLMNDMPPELLEFLKTKVNSFVKWDMIRFFHENPNTADTVDNIARYAGRGVVVVEPELREMVESGLLVARRLNQMTVYALTSDEEMRHLISEFITACDDRNFRVKAVYHIIRGMR